MKSPGALRTIGEVSGELGVAQHILRYWEGKFPQLRPVTRAGNRRYYRPEDIALLRRIDQALNRDGYTVKGVQQLLAGNTQTGAAPTPTPNDAPTEDWRSALMTVRDQLRAALTG